MTPDFRQVIYFNEVLALLFLILVAFASADLFDIVPVDKRGLALIVVAV